MKRCFKALTGAVLCTMLMFIFLPVSVNADFGPKASAHIKFENMGDELCYGTLLSENRSTGPYSAWDGKDDGIYYEKDGEYKNGSEWSEEELKIWRAFAEYEDTDGYFFLQVVWSVSESKGIDWDYYPPTNFKILLYYPETGRFAVSNICERYAFDTYYKVEMSGVDIGSAEYNEELSGNERIEAYRNYQLKHEIISLVARIVITIIIETCVALLFGFRKKRALMYITLINTVTQIVLNVLLNLINFGYGQMAFVFGYILLEIVVFAIEAAAYFMLRSRLTEKEKPCLFYVLYSFVANAVSFAAGLVAANIFPGIF